MENNSGSHMLFPVLTQFLNVLFPLVSFFIKFPLSIPLVLVHEMTDIFLLRDGLSRHINTKSNVHLLFSQPEPPDIHYLGVLKAEK